MKKQILKLLLLVIYEFMIIMVFFSVIIILVKLFLGEVTLLLLSEQFMLAIEFWVYLLGIVVVPRRLLLRSKLFRKFCIKLHWKYPFIVYYRVVYTDWLHLLLFICSYLLHYIARSVKWIFRGTTIPWLKPYRKHWEIFIWIEVIINYLVWFLINFVFFFLSRIYQIIIYFDRESWYVIFKTRIIGLIIGTGVAFLIGKFTYILFLFFLFFIAYFILRLYWVLTEVKFEEYERNIDEKKRILLCLRHVSRNYYDYANKCYDYRHKVMLITGCLAIQTLYLKRISLLRKLNQLYKIYPISYFDSWEVDVRTNRPVYLTYRERPWNNEQEPHIKEVYNLEILGKIWNRISDYYGDYPKIAAKDVMDNLNYFVPRLGLLQVKSVHEFKVRVLTELYEGYKKAELSEFENFADVDELVRQLNFLIYLAFRYWEFKDIKDFLIKMDHILTTNSYMQVAEMFFSEDISYEDLLKKLDL